ncbi:MAG: hypothetical protein AB8G11_09075 [Saprospiraceae bacterium]
MKNTLLILLIFSPLFIFGQQYIDIILIDSTNYRGDIVEYNTTEFKLVHKKKIVTIQKSNILTPKQILINSKKYITTIKTNDDNWYQGRVIIENDTSVMLRISKNMSVTILKSNIIFRTNRAKKERFIIQTTIYTKDGNKLIGQVIDKNKDFTMIDIDNKSNIQKISNQNIASETVSYKDSRTTMRRVLTGIGIIYILLISA